MSHLIRAFIIMFLTSLVVGCSDSATKRPCPTEKSSTDTIPMAIQSRAKSIALEERAKWIAENPADADQISGATVSEVIREEAGYHIVLVKSEGSVVEGTFEFCNAYFHVFLDEELHVKKVKRGPDEMT